MSILTLIGYLISMHLAKKLLLAGSSDDQDLLKVFAADSEYLVRARVASNVAAGEAVLAMLVYETGLHKELIKHSNLHMDDLNYIMRHNRTHSMMTKYYRNMSGRKEGLSYLLKLNIESQLRKVYLGRFFKGEELKVYEALYWSVEEQENTNFEGSFEELRELVKMAVN